MNDVQDILTFVAIFSSIAGVGGFFCLVVFLGMVSDIKKDVRTIKEEMTADKTDDKEN